MSFPWDPEDPEDPDEAGESLLHESLLFRRTIVKRVDCIDGVQAVTLSCGHSVIRIIPDRLSDTMDCAECVNEWVEAHRGAGKQEGGA